jgi:(1->4)-alpha-D-glucan 1-alpha-D-glucosylmutase
VVSDTGGERLLAAYRLQLGPHLDLDGAAALVPYLRELGVSHVYLSPIMRAREGSTHGYDVVDPREVAPALGGEAALERLAAAGLPVLLDIVPNHMAVDDANPFWSDPELRRRYFDIDPVTGRHRRFFDVDELAGVRVEDPEVFATTHRAVRRLIERGLVAGVRVDHVDGLADPAEYLIRLARLGVPIWVEKILAEDEPLPDWPVAGTTGYEHAAAATAAFVDPAAEGAFTGLWHELAGDERGFAEVAHEARREQAGGPFAQDVAALERMAGIGGLEEAVASLEVYRTYVAPSRGEISRHDREVIASVAAPEQVRAALLLRERGHDELVRRFQQTTPAIAAKGVEDTALYRYLRLLALNEVGAHPSRFGASVAETHARLAGLVASHPESIATSTTHDTKRSADVRARLAALSTAPDEWAAAVRRWREEHADLRPRPDAPDAVDEYLVHQTLVGAWPIGADRLEGYLTKALREAKRRTAWVAGDPGYERAVIDFALALGDRPAYVASLEALLARIGPAAEAASLGQALIRLTGGGPPDVYQGDEDDYLALVDPDNRRPVDWDRLRGRLAEVREGRPVPRGAAKIGLVHRALMVRKRHPEALAGAYTPLAAGEDVLAYARGSEVIAVIPVRPAGREAEVEIPAPLAGRWRNAMTGTTWRLAGPTDVGMLLGDHAVALLERI